MGRREKRWVEAAVKNADRNTEEGSLTIVQGLKGCGFRPSKALSQKGIRSR